MRRKIFCVVAAALLISGSAEAHHSFAMFDNTKTISLKGQVKEFQWLNPHTWIQLQVPTNGKLVEWSIEGRSPNVLSRRGWSRDVIKPGDQVTVVIYPLKDGSPGGAIVRLVLPNGKNINADTPTAVDPDEEGPRR
jgi:hypothetical protein